MDGSHRMIHTGQCEHLDLAEILQLLRIYDCGQFVEGDRAARVARAATARNDSKTKFDTGQHQSLHFLFGVGIQDHEGILDPPVGRIGHVGYARQAVEGDVVAPGDAGQAAQRLFPQLRGLVEIALEVIHRAMGRGEQLRDFSGNAVLVVAVPAALFDLAQAMAQGFDQRTAAARIVEQVVLQVRIALDHPDIAQHFVEHAGGTSGAALAAQLVEHLPHRRAEQADDDFAVGERSVVVGNFAKPDTGGREWGNGLHCRFDRVSEGEFYRAAAHAAASHGEVSDHVVAGKLACRDEQRGPPGIYPHPARGDAQCIADQWNPGEQQNGRAVPPHPFEGAAADFLLRHQPSEQIGTQAAQRVAQGRNHERGP